MNRRRAARTSRNKLCRSLVAVLSAAVVAAVLFAFFSPAIPAMVSRLADGGIWKSILQRSIPGLELVQDAGSPLSGWVWQRVIWRFTAVDLGDPKTYLQSQIAGLKMLPDPAWEALEEEPLTVPESSSPEESVSSTPSPLEHVASYPPIKKRAEEPGVIIYHTHTTESFVPTAGKPFTQNLELTVARLGRELADILEEDYGIPVLHDQTVHDIPRREAYEKARPTLQRLLKENPEVKLVLDLHRDGVARELTTAQWGEEEIAKVLLVVGTGHSRWPENHRVALSLHQQIEAKFPGISRGVRKKMFVYNQHFHPRALLIEIGGHENSLKEAQRTVPLLAEAIAEIYSSLP